MKKRLRSDWYNSFARTFGILTIGGFGGGGFTLGLLCDRLWLSILLGTLGVSIGGIILMSRWIQRPLKICFLENLPVPIVFTIVVTIAEYRGEFSWSVGFVGLLAGWLIYLYLTILSWTSAKLGDRLQQKFFPTPNIRAFSHP